MSLALQTKENALAHIFAAVRLIYVTHRDKHYGNLRHCAKPLEALLQEPEASKAIALKCGDETAKVVHDVLAFHQESVRALDNFANAQGSDVNMEAFVPPNTDIDTKLPHVKAFLEQDVDPMLVSQITLHFTQNFVMAGMLHGKPAM